MIKRAIDISLSLFFIILLSPFIICIPLLIKLDSDGSVIFSQTRVGLNQTEFIMYKFRTMVADAEQSGGYATIIGDVRITRVGKFLRKTSLDEIPQLFNVLKGDMSLVGPRPDVPMQKSSYTEKDWIKRCQVKPGITGLAQATRRSNATPLERVQLDLEYVDKASIYLDVKIMFMTIKQLLFTGSY
jgi:lipopolysaccharide/colanic/teichoic acid biosynthesis glycosyltransferase